MSARLMGWLPESGRLDATLGTLARVGATTDNDVVVRVDGVSRTHARIVGQPDGYWVEDANSKNGTWLNGERITRARLRHLDVITLGRYVEFVFVERETGQTVIGAPPPADFRVRIEWVEGPTRGSIVEIPRGETLIGRAESCAIVIDSPAISRAHARLSNTGDRVMIEDLGSANGTSVDGEMLAAPWTLQPGAEVSLGQARRFRVLIEGMSAEAAATVQQAATPARAQDMEWATRLVFSASDREAIARAAGGIDKPSPAPARGVGKSPVAPVVAAPPAAAAAPVRGTAPVAPVAPRTAPVAPGAPAAPVAPARGTAPVAPRAPIAPGPEPERTRLDTPAAGSLRVPTQVGADQPPAARATEYGGPPLAAPPPFAAPPAESGARTAVGGRGPSAPRESGDPGGIRTPQFESDTPAAPTTPDASSGRTSISDSGNLPNRTVLGFRDVGPPPRAVSAGGGGTVPSPPSPRDGAKTPSPPAPPAPPSLILSLQLSGDLGVFTLPLGTSTVGRSTEATIRIDSREVSRIHAVITVSEREVIVEDRGSVNGTTINGAPITGRRPLSHGDRVSFADFEFRVEVKRTEGN